MVVDNFCTVKLYFVTDKPGQVLQPRVAEVTADSATISWDEPEFDGGSTINNYVVEKRDINTTKGWTVASKSNVTKCSFTVKSLKAGSTFEFRVSAENESGLGVASEPTEPVTIGGKPGILILHYL